MNLADEIVKAFTLSLGSIVEGLAAIIIGAGVLRTIIFYIKTLISVKHECIDIRLDLGKTLAMALEFLLAADILRTAVAPTWSDIGKLAAIAALRTLLNYFLDRELREESKPS